MTESGPRGALMDRDTKQQAGLTSHVPGQGQGPRCKVNGDREPSARCASVQLCNRPSSPSSRGWSLPPSPGRLQPPTSSREGTGAVPAPRARPPTCSWTRRGRRQHAWEAGWAGSGFPRRVCTSDYSWRGEGTHVKHANSNRLLPRLSDEPKFGPCYLSLIAGLSLIFSLH